MSIFDAFWDRRNEHGELSLEEVDKKIADLRSVSALAERRVAELLLLVEEKFGLERANELRQIPEPIDDKVELERLLDDLDLHSRDAEAADYVRKLADACGITEEQAWEHDRSIRSAMRRLAVHLTSTEAEYVAGTLQIRQWIDRPSRDVKAPIFAALWGRRNQHGELSLDEFDQELADLRTVFTLAERRVAELLSLVDAKCGPERANELKQIRARDADAVQRELDALSKKKTT